MNYYNCHRAERDRQEIESDETLTPQASAPPGAALRHGIHRYPKIEEITITKIDGGWEMSTDYESEVPFMGNLYMVVDFTTAVPILNN